MIHTLAHPHFTLNNLAKYDNNLCVYAVSHDKRGQNYLPHTPNVITYAYEYCGY